MRVELACAMIVIVVAGPRPPLVGRMPRRVGAVAGARRASGGAPAITAGPRTLRVLAAAAEALRRRAETFLAAAEAFPARLRFAMALLASGRRVQPFAALFEIVRARFQQAFGDRPQFAYAGGLALVVGAGSPVPSIGITH
ncbi:hypothetical protein [Luteimonas sp. SDU101]|uniref:hypothetical protein n=1 Tax=Luteimonas sp. SDU101 TaxID=3422593 RepID=UPI003EC010B9